MKTFEISYTTESGVDVVERQTFEDWRGRATLNGLEVGPVLNITARDWAEDYAYSISHDHMYEIREI